MALIFRYRYVDFGTVFSGAPGIRGAENATESPGTLYANELVTDVGGTCWDRNEPLSIIDHHFSRDNQFPSASAAVLHKAKLIREKFSTQQSEVIWLVTHKQPDFDAFCSLYLARWIVEEPDAPVDWEPYGLHHDGWLDCPSHRKIDWFDPHIDAAPAAHRWALLLASYASVVDNARRIACPRQRALHSLLYAALKRGRDYLNDTSGAREFFDEVKTSLQENELNPMFDSVLEGSSQFAPELALLDREVEAYNRDLVRARKSIVYLPESEAPFPNFFKSVKDVAPVKEKVPVKSLETNTDHLLLADTFRIPTDGIYLRDPECLLFQEWARLDLESSALGAGFEFTAIACSGQSAGTVNQSDYSFAIDPERANGRHLYTVWSRLQTKEVEALRTQEAGQSGSLEAGRSLRNIDKRPGELGQVFTDPWFDGHNCFGTIVAPPHRGTRIGPPGVRRDLRDDPVAEAVRTELEDSIYFAESLVSGPQVVVTDLSGAKNEADAAPRHFDLNALHDSPSPRERSFRFGSVWLRADVPIAAGGMARHGLAEQIAETLWQVLYPDLPYDKPPDFQQRHLVITADSVGVWGQRGIVIARHVPVSDAAGIGRQREDEDDSLRDDFGSVVALVRDIDQLIADGETLAPHAQSSTAPGEHRTGRQKTATDSADKIVARGEDLERRAAQVKHNLTLPDRDLLRRFCEAIRLDELLGTMRELNRAATEVLRRDNLEEQAGSIAESTRTVAEFQSKLRWLEVFVVGLYATQIIEMLTRRVPGFDQAWGPPVVLLGGLSAISLAAWTLRPWQRPSKKKPGSEKRLVWMLGIVIASYIVGLALWRLFPQPPR